MRVGERAVGDQGAGAEQIVGGGDVVTGLVPVVGQAQQSCVREVESDEDQRKDQPQGEGLVCLPIRLLSCGRSEEGDDCCLRGLWIVRRQLI